MCWSCVRGELEEGGPVTVTAEHLAVGQLIRRLYATDWGTCGGPLHITLDDNNVEDSSLDFCEADARRCAADGLYGDDCLFTEADLALCLDIIDGMRAMPSTADRSLAAVADGQFPVGTLVLVDARWPGAIVVGSRWPR